MWDLYIANQILDDDYQSPPTWEVIHHNFVSMSMNHSAKDWVAWLSLAKPSLISLWVSIEILRWSGYDTLGYSSSPLPYRLSLKALRVRCGAASLTSLSNIGEEDLRVWIVPELDLRVPVTKTSTNYLIPHSLLVKLIWDSGDSSPKLKTSGFSRSRV